jgi:hypothetical protein
MASVRQQVANFIGELRDGGEHHWIDENTLSVGAYSDAFGDKHPGFGLNFRAPLKEFEEFTTLQFAAKFIVTSGLSLEFVNSLNLKSRFTRYSLADDGLSVSLDVYCPDLQLSDDILLAVYTIFDMSLRIIIDLSFDQGN